MGNHGFLPVLFRWFHILSAVTIVGGTIFLRLVVVPFTRGSLTPDQHAELRQALVRRWNPLVRICMVFLLGSGIYNFLTYSVPRVEAGELLLYHPLFGLKVLCALTIFFLLEALTGKAEAFRGIRSNPAKWLNVTILLMVLVILLSGFLRSL
jgi:uncharacterized membrane protein